MRKRERERESKRASEKESESEKRDWKTLTAHSRLDTDVQMKVCSLAASHQRQPRAVSVGKP